MKRPEFLAFVAPSVVVMVGLMIVPLLFTIFLSFNRYSMGQSMEWVGLGNYATVLGNSRFWNAARWTLTYIAFTIPLQLLIGFLMALLLDRVQHFQGVMITGSLLPFIVTPVVGTLVFSWLFQDKWGFYSWVLSLLGINIKWFADVNASKALLIIYGVWQVTPFVFLVLYAGLQAMPREPLESATIDGATTRQQIWHIVIPALRPLFIFVIMINLMDGYRVFDSVYVMTKGGPGSATESLMFYNYQVAFAQGILGRGSAISVLTIIGIFVVLLPFLVRTYKEQTQAQ
jgi:multiple sugar transport system permease protein